ncbi:MAG: LysR substrate-binding domain-containing protein [Pseudomonadota bacterium]|uniref:LysR substrate-binding domain-containing protein n=1 Tax=Pseudoalteromonas sp. XMcav1-K TaxID=3374372 RepID=UPI002EABE5AE|nr:LysR substrate-binding domain-containing protein [Pseudomonadota bacterium]
MALTCEAKQLYSSVKKAFSEIEFGIEKAQAPKVKKLVIAAIPSVVSCVLVNKLAELQALLPNYQIHFISQHQIVNFEQQNIDCHIHFGNGKYANAVAEKLANEVVYPVCAPNVYEMQHELPLIHYAAGMEDKPGGISWQHWQKHFNLPMQSPCLVFDEVGLALSAAQHEQGKTLAWHQLAKHAISQNQLERIGSEQITLPFSYYFVTHKDFSERDELKLLFTWLERLFCL